MKTRMFTAGILMRRERVLVLKRKQDDDTYPGLWDCVGGHFERGESAQECMLRETREEAGLEATIVKTGRLIEYRDGYGRSLAVPFLLRSARGEVVLTEHAQFRWATLEAARLLSSVPVMKLALDGFAVASERINA
jgi:8-oxo-dGTP diphosphatase